MNAPQWQAQPRLYQDLRLSLAVLYTLPCENQQALPSPDQAHEYLIFQQSRNGRRKILSIHQQQRDLLQKQQQLQDAIENPITTGSSWLALLALLLLPDASPTERLFAAQSLLHRLRRARIVEAIDLELEAYTNVSSRQVALQHYRDDQSIGPSVLSAYRLWIQQVNPMVSHILEQHSALSSVTDEEHIKGDLSLLTLATLISHEPLDQQHAASGTGGPYLSTLATCLATMAVRLKYRGGNVPPVPTVTLFQQLFAGQSNPVALHLCLASLPDVVLTKTRQLSMDPKQIQATIQALRTTELSLLWEWMLQQRDSGSDSDLWFLRTMERWARHLPLDPQLAGTHLVPLLNRHLITTTTDPNHHRAALALLLSILEGASWSYDKVLAASLGLGDAQQQHQPNRKRQSSRSKRKQEKVVSRETSDSIEQQAEREVVTRRQVACFLVGGVLRESLGGAVQQALSDAATHPQQQVDGEGPLGVLAEAVTACVPYLLEHGQEELFRALTEIVPHVCASAHPAVRAMSYEPLHTVHKAILELLRNDGNGSPQVQLEEGLEGVVVEFFGNCALSLAQSCGYPPHYFDNMVAPSDEALEIERNDVRDVLRSVTGSGEGGSTSSVELTHGSPFRVSSRVLLKVLQACHQVIVSAHEDSSVVPSVIEAAIHALSSLAKPLNSLAKYATMGAADAMLDQILHMAHETLSRACELTIHAYSNGMPDHQLLPLGRIVDIAIAALSPMLAATCHRTPDFHSKTLPLLVECAVVSIERIPELVGDSILGRYVYDIRGAMRGPAGEDHVGCLTLMRLLGEGPDLSNSVASLAPSLVPRLCALQQHLKVLESQRGIGVSHGSGVAPHSRRILIGVLFRLEEASNGAAGVGAQFEQFFQSSVHSIAAMNGQHPLSARSLFEMVETTFDLSWFPPTILSSLFNAPDSDSVYTKCLETITSTCIAGYAQHHAEVTEEIKQWNRLRAAIHHLIGKIPSHRGCEMAAAIAMAECESARAICDQGIHATSCLYNDLVVSEDVVPAGLFIQALGLSVLDNKKTANPTVVQTLARCSTAVLSAVMHPCPEPDSFCDPRPCLLEAWLFAMRELTKAEHRDSNADKLLVDSCAAIVAWLFCPSLEKQQQMAGVSVDGPQSLVLTSFLQAYFQLGSAALIALGNALLQRVPVDRSSIVIHDENNTTTDNMTGLSILMAALYRATQGALPPWAVEAIPDVYRSLFFAMEQNANQFQLVLRLGMEVRTTLSFGRIQPGALLSGHFFEDMSSHVKGQFFKEVKDICNKHEQTASWRRLKTIVKQVCGGKKKDADFKQKPPPTKWDFQRV